MSDGNQEEADRKAVYRALAKVQSTALKAAKDAKNPFFNSKYATLAEVMDVVREPLASNGFAITQDADTDIEKMTVGVVTTLYHESGVSLASTRLSAPLRAEFNKAGKELPPDVQQIGSMVTYLRRYSLCAFLAVAVEDDDGNAGAGKDAQAAGGGGMTQGHKDVRTQGQEERTGGPLPPPVRRSAHTGEALDTPEAVARHKAAAGNEAGGQRSEAGGQRSEVKSQRSEVKSQRSEVKSQRSEVRSQKLEAGGEKQVPWPKNQRLVEVLQSAGIQPWMLDGYLRGNLGEPRIKRPMLMDGMGVDALGDEIVGKLLLPENWSMVRERIEKGMESPLD